VFGPDLDELQRLAQKTQSFMGTIPGVADLRAEQLGGLPQLRITVDREAAARVGLTPGEVVQTVRIGLVGEEFSQVWIGQRRFDLVLRLQDDRRRDLGAVRSLLIDAHDGSKVTLGQVARIEEAFGPAAV